ncbi:MAG: methylmalonyl Co-A mutase-associated GTPase MeaB [Bacteroidetes bacterium]|nr:MAG: methylmalonyl Co-A mutase-associated GTPase MeaB [Bacteroidota bacterium]
MVHLKEQLDRIMAGDFKTISRCISLIENEAGAYEHLLKALPNISTANIIGITGPPGAGKSTLVDSIIGSFVAENEMVAVICVDPSSPFSLGALLGDRIRMSEWYTHPGVFIRSLASRGSHGGLNPKIIEITDLLKAGPFKYIIVETVGVGQSEIEIAGLADTTMVVLVPEAGDEVQTMKAGLMEIADIFVVNKSDRPDADLFERNLRLMLSPAIARVHHEIPIVKTVASSKTGIDELMTEIKKSLKVENNDEKKMWLLTEKAFQLIQQKKMKEIDKGELQKKISTLVKDGNFNLYAFIENI